LSIRGGVEEGTLKNEANNMNKKSSQQKIQGKSLHGPSKFHHSKKIKAGICNWQPK
jgi:hypothetical protein